MSVMEILKQRFALSFEVSPPKTDVGMEKLCASGGMLEQLYALHPDAISCSYGIGGRNLGKNLTVLDKIIRDSRTIGITCFSCSGNTGDSAAKQLQTYQAHGINHMLLQGDLSAGRRTAGGENLDTAQLICLVRQRFEDDAVIAAEGFLQGSCSIAQELERLKREQDCGADYIVTRLCWDMEQFYRWLDAFLAADIRMPVVAGVMPAVDQAVTVSAALSSNGGVLPDALARMVSQNWIYPNPFARDPFDPEAERKKAAFKAAGMEYTINQIWAYRACGIGGIHLEACTGTGEIAHIVNEAGLRG